jgi:adenylate cyclase
MCVWAGKAGDPQLKKAALHAALAICEAVASFNRQHTATPMPIRIGIDAGEVLLGAVGGSGRYVPTVLGDVPNTASRLEALNKLLETRVLASSAALTGVQGLIVRPLGQFELRGKSRSVEVVEIMGPADTSGENAALAADFAMALAAYHAGRFDDAAQLFEAVLRRHPNDGPSAYFSTEIRRLSAASRGRRAESNQTGA